MSGCKGWLAVGLVLGAILGAWSAGGADAGNAPAAPSKPRLVMVKISHWKVGFFHLPGELPVLVKSGETFDPSRGLYDFEEGMEAMEVFLQVKPKDPLAPAFRLFLEKWPMYQKFFKAVDSEEYEQARGLIEKIGRLDPAEPAAHFYSGSLYSQSGEYAQAEKAYRRCLELFPAYGPVYINLARLAMARGARSEAEGYLRQAVEKAEGADQAATRRLAGQMLESLQKP